MAVAERHRVAQAQPDAGVGAGPAHQRIRDDFPAGEAGAVLLRCRGEGEWIHWTMAPRSQPRGVMILISSGEMDILNVPRDHIPQVEQLRYGANARNVWRSRRRAARTRTLPPTRTSCPGGASMAGTSERGVCADCGAPWVRVVEKSGRLCTDSGRIPDANTTKRCAYGRRVRWLHMRSGGREPENTHANPNPRLATHLRLQRGHGAGTVLDPFAGSGTTLAVAQALGRQSRGAGPEPRVPGDCQAIHQPGRRYHPADGALLTQTSQRLVCPCR